VTTDQDTTLAIAEELKLPPQGVGAVVRLLAENATVPFIARYRKEATGGLDEVQIRAIEERRAYLVDFADRRATVTAEIEKQGKLTAELAAKILACRSKADLEDLYLPFKPKRRTRATIAKERGLEPLADRIWAQPSDGSPAGEASAFVDAAKEVADVAAALAGARDIVAERIAEKAEVRKLIREAYGKDGVISVTKTREHKDQTTKFDTYAAFSEPVANIPSHRYLAIRRGESEGVLSVDIELDATNLLSPIARAVGKNPRSPWSAELDLAVADATKRLLLPTVQTDVRVDLKLQSDRAAVDVFAQNLRELLLAAPFGGQLVIGIDPGQRTGCKCAVVDATGKVLEHTTIYLVQGDGALQEAKAKLRALCKRHQPRAIAVGNGTHGRETEAFVREVLAEANVADVHCVSVSESGASVYSASEIAREEFPDLDLTVRGAISIARRLQDPLAELCKVDPKSIGVGQYQHDVHQPLLAKRLDEVVESCVNSVGVELNTASAPLLSRVAGIGPTLAKRIVDHRNEHGAFKSRKKLLDVAGVGPRTFEQCAGFLRIRDGEHPLDASAVHPERYPLVERIATDLGTPVATLVGNETIAKSIDPRKYLGGDVGEFTMNDILAELKKPGRDPRATFEPPKFRDDVRSLDDLTPGMELEGVVTNVTAFGAFVDVGVHQDGLVHVSQLADRFVKTPSDVVKVGDKLRVRVLDVDRARKRISLSAKRGEVKPRPATQERGQRSGGDRQTAPRTRARGDARPTEQASGSFRNNPFADRFRK
jgi:uncharacterized protein